MASVESSCVLQICGGKATTGSDCLRTELDYVPSSRVNYKRLQKAYSPVPWLIRLISTVHKTVQHVRLQKAGPRALLAHTCCYNC
eukprot:1155321-Pelagomonas_calceolata.AAC.2